MQINLQKYALFEIKRNGNETIYLYCSDIESTTNNGMFENCNSIKNVSVVRKAVSGTRILREYNCNC